MTATWAKERWKSAKWREDGHAGASPRWLARGILACAVAGGALLSGAATSVWAQDPTDPGAIVCAVPAVAAVTTESETPEADAPARSPAASPQASPIASPDAGRVADPATAAQVESVIRTLAACLTQGQPEVVADLVTERYLGQMYGGSDRMRRDEYLALAPTLPTIPVLIEEIGQVRLDGERRATVEVVSLFGSQLQRGEWQLVRGAGESPWRVDRVTPLEVEPPRGSSRIRVRLDEHSFSLNTRRVEGPNVVLSGTNRGEEDHEMLVLRLEQGISTDVLLTNPGPNFPNGVTFIGQVTVPVGESADLVLVDLQPGSYALVCLLPDEDGVPHLSLGMRTRFNVTR